MPQQKSEPCEICGRMVTTSAHSRKLHTDACAKKKAEGKMENVEQYIPEDNPKKAINERKGKREFIITMADKSVKTIMADAILERGNGSVTFLLNRGTRENIFTAKASEWAKVESGKMRKVNKKG